MKDFLRRLKYYGFGFLIGSIMVFFMFENRGCSWFPSNRVKEQVFNRMIVVNAHSLAEIKKQGFSTSQFLQTIQNGSIDFGKSKKQGLDKIYRVDFTNKKGKEAHCFMTLGDESFISEIIFSPKKAFQITPSNASEKHTGTILFCPKNEFLFYRDSAVDFTQKLGSYGIKTDQQLNKILREKAVFNFSESSLMKHPKPIHCLQYLVDGPDKKWIQLKCIWFKDKIKVFAASENRQDF